MSTAQVEKEVLKVLRQHRGVMPASDLSASLKKSVSPARRREALLNLATRQEVKVASGRVAVIKK